MTDIAPVFPAFPAISGKKVTAAFDGGKITSNAGVLLLAQAEKRLGIKRGYAPIHVYEAETARPVAFVLRPAKTPSGREVATHRPLRDDLRRQELERRETVHHRPH